jgi:phosphoglycerate dehydrogenase-like enzyme
MTRPIIEACPRLRIIAKATIGVEVIDIDAAPERGILVCNSPALENLIGVAEGAIGQMLALVKRVAINERLLREGKWRADERLGELLWGKTIGIVGLGRIGSNVARRLQTWDVKVLAADPYVEPGHAVSVGARLVPLDELLPQVDVVTIHVNLTAETRHLLDERRLRSMQPTAYLVNTSRGPVVDEAALCRAITEGWIAGAALDVFEEEPLRPGNPILGLDPDRVLLTPHAIGANRAMRETGTVMAVENMLRALRGELPGNIVNPDAIAAWRSRFAAASGRPPDRLGSSPSASGRSRPAGSLGGVSGASAGGLLGPGDETAIDGLDDPVADERQHEDDHADGEDLRHVELRPVQRGERSETDERDDHLAVDHALHGAAQPKPDAGHDERQ